MVSLLCLSGADVDKLSDDRLTPLNLAAMRKCMAATQALLAAGADVSLRCRGGMSPLDRAAGEGQVDIARVLLEHGADANAARADGYTPLHAAAMCDRAEIVSLLCIKGADVDKAGSDGRTPLEVAAKRGHAAAARPLLAEGADATLRHGAGGHSALIVAAANGHVDVLVAIVEHGVDVDVGGHGAKALHIAAAADEAAAIEVLLESGADIEARMDGSRSTPLSLAAERNYVSAVVVLLKHGACVCIRFARERTALHNLVAYAGKLGTAEVVDLLLRHGADENATSSDSETSADVVGSDIEEEDSVAEDVERVRQLLANAPADRAWRRRCFLVLCRAHYPSGRVQLGHESSHAHDTGNADMARSSGEPLRAEAEWAGVASMLMGVGADPISLMGEGVDIILETIVGFM